MMQVQGRDLSAGDVIASWWRARRDVIVRIYPHPDPSGIFPAGARIAEFATLPCGMTIANDEMFERVEAQR